MIRLMLGVVAIWLLIGCGDGGNDSNNGDSESDSSMGTDGDAGAGNSDLLWDAAWSVMGTRCGSAGACHNVSKNGGNGLNLPADDESTAKANAEARKDDVRREISTGGMPKDGPLPTEDQNKIIDWIDSL
jgi:hypothetical protein